MMRAPLGQPLAEAEMRRREAVMEILALPDPPDIAGKRGNRPTVEGRADRGSIALGLAMAYVAHRMEERARG